MAARLYPICTFVSVYYVCIYMRQRVFVWVVGRPGREELSVWEVAIKTQSRDIWGGLMTLHGSVFGRTLRNVRWDTLMYTHPPLLKQIFDRVYSGVGGHSGSGGFWCFRTRSLRVLILTRLQHGPPLNFLAFIKWNTNKFTRRTS